MSNPWSPADPKPLPNTRELLRTQMPNAPERLVEASLDELAPRAVGEASPVAAASPTLDEILTRLAAAEAAAADAKAQVAALTGQVTLLGAQVASLQAANTKLEAAAAASVAGSDTADAIHKRLAALEARPAPARAVAPAARPAASA